MKEKKSEFGKIKPTDLLNALYHAIGAVAIPFFGYLSTGRMPTESELYILLSVFGSALFADIFKRSVTNSEGKVFKKEN